MRLAAERGRRIDRALTEAVADLEARDRAFAHELAYGATRLRGRLDHLLAPHVRRGLDGLDPVVREALRLGVFQWLCMDSVPDYAAVSTSVDLARARAGRGAAGLVNAVLKRTLEAGVQPECFPPPDDALAYLSTWGSHPRWLVQRWLDRWGPEATGALVEVNNRRPDVFLHPLDASVGTAVALLRDVGLAAEPAGGGSRCVRLPTGASPVAALDAVPAAVIQDPGANLVVLYSDVPAGTIVADLCAAPGGKALAAAGRARLTLASDRSESRLRMLADNARRVGRSLSLVVADARRPPLARADVVLADVPCTGTGTFSRHPDARWRLQPGSIAAMARLQREILASAAEVVAPGGVLVYSTCSLEEEENEAVVLDLLARRGDFRVESTDAVPERWLDARGFLFVTPQDGGFDGAFAARLRRAA